MLNAIDKLYNTSDEISLALSIDDAISEKCGMFADGIKSIMREEIICSIDCLVTQAAVAFIEAMSHPANSAEYHRLMGSVAGIVYAVSEIGGMEVEDVYSLVYVYMAAKLK